MFIDGKDVTNVDVRQRQVGMVFQSYALFPNMTAAQNVAFGLSIKKAAQGRNPQEGSAHDGAGGPGGQGKTSAPASCRAASSSAWPWRARW